MRKSLLFAIPALALAALACSLFSGGAIQPGSNSPKSSSTPADLQSAVEALPEGDAARGERIFKTDQACHACHMDQAVGPRFPGSPGLAAAAASRREGYTAEMYLYESILNPGAYVVQGYQGDIMPGDFGKLLSKQELADLIAYLKTMK
jgi:cytochrome c2